MGVELAEGEDTEMNMTPMIDIVFQLIIFFMLQLKFKEIDRQIDSNLPKDRGMAATSAEPKEFQKVKIKLFRREFDKPESEQYTLIKVDNSDEVHLPKHWRGHGHPDETPERIALYEARIAEVQKIVKAKYDAQPVKEDVKGEIVAPAPKGGFVPHGDVMRMLDIFLILNFTDVVFEGQATPLTREQWAAAARAVEN